MPLYFFQWTPDVVAHCAEHDVTPDDFEEAFRESVWDGFSRQTGDRCKKGYDSRGRFLFCVYEKLSDVDILPITAYEVEEFR